MNGGKKREKDHQYDNTSGPQNPEKERHIIYISYSSLSYLFPT